MQNRIIVGERMSVGQTVEESLGRRRLFVIPLTNALLNVTKMKLNVYKCDTYSEMMTRSLSAMSRARGAIIFLFELFQNIT